MNDDFLKIAVYIAVPLSIITSIQSYISMSKLDTMEGIISRQYDIHPNDFREFTKILPYVQRTVRIDKVKYYVDSPSKNNATVYFYDHTTKRLFNQTNVCSNLVNYVGKSYHVKYDANTGRYGLSCHDGFYEK